jgi:hypothetical protein
LGLILFSEVVGLVQLFFYLQKKAFLLGSPSLPNELGMSMDVIKLALEPIYEAVLVTYEK